MTSSDFAPVIVAEAAQSLSAGAHDDAVEAQTHGAETGTSHRRLGARLRVIRKNAGLSQTEAAQMFGLSYQQWQKYEAGQNRISAVTLHRLACILNVDVGQILAVLDEDAMRWADQVGSRNHQAERMTGLFNALRQRDQETLLALATRLADSSAEVERDTPCAVTQGGSAACASSHARHSLQIT
jgi:transcriptional regulator with XRE-family HTH domain